MELYLLRLNNWTGQQAQVCGDVLALIRKQTKTLNHNYAG